MLYNLHVRSHIVNEGMAVRVGVSVDDVLTIDWHRNVRLQSFVFVATLYHDEGTIRLFTRQFGIMPSLWLPEYLVTTKTTKTESNIAVWKWQTGSIKAEVHKK